MYEPEDEMSGEQSAIRNALGLDKQQYVKAAKRCVYYNEQGVASFLLGIGPSEPAIRLMALSLSGEVDLRDCWVIIAGIAGADPMSASLGSVIWSRCVVDGDLAFDIDGREIPQDWPTGIFALGSNGPGRDVDWAFGQKMAYDLPGEMLERCFAASCNVPLMDSVGIGLERYRYEAFSKAREKPMVGKGGSLACSRFWHGEHHTQWARGWVSQWTRGRDSLVTSNMEDVGTLRALSHLSELGVLAFEKVACARSVSNFCMPPAGKTAAENIAADGKESDRYPALEASLENLGRVIQAAAADLLK